MMTSPDAQEYYQNPLGQKLRCQFHAPTKNVYDKPPVLAYVPGIGGGMRSPATVNSMQTVLENGWAVFCFDPVPTKDVKNGPFDFKADTRHLSPHTYIQTIHAALHHLEDHHKDEVDMDKLSLHCSSLGAYCGGWYAAHANGLADQHRVLKEKPYALKGVVFQSPVLNPLGVAEKIVDNPILQSIWRNAEYVPWFIGGELLKVSYNVYKESRGVDFNRDIAPHITAPVTIHFGKSDPLEKVSTICAFKENLSQSPEVELHLYEDAGHGMEDRNLLKTLPEKMLAASLDGRNIFRTRSGREMHYMIKNFLDVTHCREATNRSIEFLKKCVV